MLLDGPVGHLWYKVLDHHVCPDKPKSTKAVLLKTAADQVIWAPIMTVSPASVDDQQRSSGFLINLMIFSCYHVKLASFNACLSFRPVLKVNLAGSGRASI